MKKVVDSRGFACPLPVIQMEAALRGMAPGDSLLILADDPIANIDIPYFCQEAGHIVVKLTVPELEIRAQAQKFPFYTGLLPINEADVCVFQVTAGRKMPPPPSKTP